MAKYSLVIASLLVLVALLNLTSVAAKAHGDRGEWKKTMDECKTQEGATDEDFKNMKDPNEPKTQGMKCVFTCMAEKSGMLKDGLLEPEGISNWMKKMPDYNDQTQQSVNEILEECKNETDPDRCENGSKQMQCFKQGAEKRGIKPASHHGHGHSNN